MFGDFFGKKEILELMVKHSVAKQLYSAKRRSFIKNYGHLIFKLLGYPLAVTHRQRVKIVMKYLSPKKGDKILDAGCGIGYFAFELATKFGCKVEGIDIDAEDIALANQITEKMRVPNLTFSVSDLSNLPFRDQTFNKIILLDVIAHVVNDRTLLSELFRVLKPQGHLVVSTPYVDVMAEFYTNKPPLDGRRLRNGYSFEMLVEILNNAGFEIVESQYFVKKFTKEVSGFMFLLAYPFSKLDYLLRGKGKGIVVRAKK